MNGIDYLTKLADEKKPLEEIKREAYEALVFRKDKALATEIIYKGFMQKNRVYAIRSDEKQEIWIYKNGIYIENGASYIAEYVRDILGESYTSQMKNLVVEKVEIDNYADANDFFNFNNDIELIPVQNGLLNIMTQKLQDFSPDKIFFTKLPVVFDETKNCPLIKRFVSDICGDNSDIETIRQYLGYCLLRENRYEKMMMVIGGGRNGKTKLSVLFSTFLGGESVSGLQPVNFENSQSFETYMLHGKLANMYMDISRTAFKNTSLLKSLSGRDSITVPRKYKTALTFTNTCKFIFGANDLPISYDISSGFWQRWLLISLPYSFQYQDVLDSKPEVERHKYKLRKDNIIDEITTPDELSGMLNWALGGLKDLIKQGKFTYKYTEDEVKSLWIRESDSFGAFFMDCCEYKYDVRIPKQELLKGYSEYCREHGLRMVSPRKIAHNLSEQGCFDSRYRENDKDFYVWENICFKEIYRAKTDVYNMEHYKKPTVTEKIQWYMERQTQARLQDLYFKFSPTSVDKMLQQGLLIRTGDDIIRINA